MGPDRVQGYTGEYWFVHECSAAGYRRIHWWEEYRDVGFGFDKVCCLVFLVPWVIWIFPVAWAWVLRRAKCGLFIYDVGIYWLVYRADATTSSGWDQQIVLKWRIWDWSSGLFSDMIPFGEDSAADTVRSEFSQKGYTEEAKRERRQPAYLAFYFR